MDSDSFKQQEEIFKSILLKYEAEDILTPVSKIQFIDIDDSSEHILEIIKTNPYSYYPVYEDGVDNIIGILNTTDFFMNYPAKKNLRDILRYPLFISENKNIIEILKDYQKKDLSFAVVVDEHGSVRGIVTKHNILSFLWKDEDNNDEIDECIIDNQNHFLIDPKLPLDEFNKKFTMGLECEDCDTIGGYVIERLTYVPNLGEEYQEGKMHITVSKTEGAKLLEFTVKFI